MNTVKGYLGSTERINFVVSEVLKILSEFINTNLTCDGGRAWGRGIYISDCLFTVRIYTSKIAYEFDQINGLREYHPNYFNKQISCAQEAAEGRINHFTIEQAKSFLEYNK
jgi:hypothetical protein